ncbi:MAG: hypothetical protein Q7T21_03320 [Gallionella sp.]|nr:hypothetical protein [Gallionella sp.]
MTMMMRRKSTLTDIDSWAIGVTGSGKSQIDFAYAAPDTRRKKESTDNSVNCFLVSLVVQKFAVLWLLLKQEGRMNHLQMVHPSWIAASVSFMGTAFIEVVSISRPA